MLVGQALAFTLLDWRLKYTNLVELSVMVAERVLAFTSASKQMGISYMLRMHVLIDVLEVTHDCGFILRKIQAPRAGGLRVRHFVGHSL